ncbi:cytochrome P450 [Irpex rosettiformis]|uniref:Cytochrome P450 n=1 Tax=Irpex rosettiformis TaxID=378272 RepID=A0ACB8U1U4_9APHY|nr:cytochrome P450 [Irpex rosettiformis]
MFHTAGVVEVASLATYLFYRTFEPTQLASHLTLLLLVPSALVRYLYPADDFSAYSSAFLQYWSSILVFTAVYRLSPLHPLAQYPGPFFAKTSKLWAAYITFKEGNLHWTIQELHAKYGAVVRVGPNELSFASADAIEPILAAKQFPKGPYYNSRRQGELIPLDGYLKDYEGDVHDKVKQLVDALETRAKKGETVNISDWMSFFGFDFMGSMMHDFGMLKAGNDVDGLWHLLESGVKLVGWASHISWVLPILKYLPGSEEAATQLSILAKRLVKARIEIGMHRKDLFYYLMDEKDSSRIDKAQFDSLTADGMMAVIAGSDTTAKALSQLWYFLARNPQYYEKLRKEVLLENEGDLNRQASMPYLNACINEALRMYPPVISGLQRRLEYGSGGKVVADHFVPEGTQISVHLFSIQRSSRHFYPLPDTFRPDRWLTNQTYMLPNDEVIPASEVKTDKSVFLPFSAGPQSCVGKGVAIIEMRAVTDAVVRRFESMDIEGRQSIASFENWERCLRDVYVQVRGPLMVKLKLSQ